MQSRTPYRPGAGHRPPLLAGRCHVLDSLAVVQRRAEELGEGDRGSSTASAASARPSCSPSCSTTSPDVGGSPPRSRRARPRPCRFRSDGPSSTACAPPPATIPSRRLRRLLGIVEAFSLKVDPSGNVSLGVDVQPIHGIADSGHLSDDLSALFGALGENARDLGIGGVLVLIDELPPID
jgi:hypothetical protein